jgi:hypothetical protein
VIDPGQLSIICPPPEQYATATMKRCREAGIDEDVISLVKSWALRSPVLKRRPRPAAEPLRIIGPIGSPMALLATAVWRWFISKSRTGAWFTSPDLEQILRSVQAYDPDENDAAIYSLLRTCSVVCVDDICRLGSEHEGRLLEALMHTRMGNGLPTIVTVADEVARVPEGFEQWLNAHSATVILDGTW